MIGFDLEKFRDRNRVLIIYTPSADKDIYQWQLRELQEYKDGIRERDLVIVHLVKDSRSYAEDRDIAEEDRKEILKKYKIQENSFAAVLLGKDGMPKYRDDKPVAMEDIFAIIDSMPDRKTELWA